MKDAFSEVFLTPLIGVMLAAFALLPPAEAAGRGVERGGSHVADGGGRKNVQVNNTRADVRTNNVRSTSVNNVNVNRNVNVHVDNNDHGCCHNGWDNDYHPVATAAAVTATVAVVGSIVRSVPPSCVPVNYRGMVYQQCGSTWYQPQGGQYIVINPPY